MMGTGGALLPHELSLATDSCALGRPAPDFQADTEAAFDLPLILAAGNPNHAINPLTNWILLEPLHLLMSYQSAHEGGVEPRAAVWPLQNHASAFHLAAAVGERPLVLVLAHPADYWAWHFTLAPELEMLHRAAGELAHFVLVNVTVHDTIMAAEDPFPSPALPGLAFGSGRPALYHPVTQDERARLAGLLKLALPFFSIPMVFDNQGQTIRNAYRDRGGEATFVVIDRDGRVVYWDRANRLPASPHFYREYRWQRLQALAARLVDLAAQDGRDTDPAAWKYPELWHTPAAQEASTKPTPKDVHPSVATRTHVVFAGHLRGCAGQLIEVEGLPVNCAKNLALWDTPRAQAPKQDTALRIETMRAWQHNGAPETYHLREDAMIVRNGRVATVNDLQPGDRIGLRTMAGWDQASPHPVDMIFAFSQP